MGRAKDEYFERMEMQQYSSKIAEAIGITEDELDQLTYDIEPHTSKDGMLYYYIVTFYGDNDPKILKNIERLEDGCYVSLHPSELDNDDYVYDYGYDSYQEKELEWQINHSNQFEMFNGQLLSISMLMNSLKSNHVEFSFLVMLHTHVVSSFEYFLSSTFITRVTKSNILIGKLIDTDPEIMAKKYTLKEIYIQNDGIRSLVAKYLNGIIFHNISKVGHLFKNVLSFEFTDIEWLYRSIELRHDCAHRAGYDKEGNAISISVDSINDLMEKCQELAEKIDKHMTSLDAQELSDRV